MRKYTVKVNGIAVGIIEAALDEVKEIEKNFEIKLYPVEK